MAIDLGASYRAARLRIADLVNDNLGDRQVPATPDWSVHDVVSHLYGVMTDVSSGNLDGVATPVWTAAQVQRCRDRQFRVETGQSPNAARTAGFQLPRPRPAIPHPANFFRLNLR